MHNNFTSKLLDLKGVKITKISHSDTFIKIHLSTNPKENNCPICGSKTSRVHDYREQVIKDVPFQFKHVYLVLRKRIYIYALAVKNFMNPMTFFLAITA